MVMKALPFEMKWMVLAIVAALSFIGIFDHSLWTPDEPREAQIVREMSLNGEYLIPSLGGDEFLEKPPLYYLAAAGFYRLLGSHFPEAGRVASALFALGALAVVFFVTRRVFSEEAALLAPLILATFPLFFLAAHKMLVDMGLVFFITAAMGAFLVACGEQGRSWSWYTAFWLFLAGAFLCKGIVGLAIPGTALLVFMIWQRDAGFLRRARVVPGVLLLLGVMAAWGGVLYLKGGWEYLHTFYVYNQFGRFIPLGGIYDGGHVRPFFYYLTRIPALAAPFILLLIPAAARARGMKASEKILWAWLLGGLLILSLSSTKREIYFLPMFPAMAMIIAHWAATLKESGPRPWEVYLLRGILAVVSLAVAAVPVAYVKMGGGLMTAVMVSAILLSLLLTLWMNFRESLPLLAVLGWSLVILLWVPAVIPQIDKAKSYKGIFEDMGRIVQHRQAVGYRITETVEALGPFYGGFPVKNIEDRDLMLKAMTDHEADFVLVLPSRMGEDLKRRLASLAQPVYHGGGETRRELELWKMNSSR